MKCHYDVLEVSRSADESEIKSAYRKLALRWHPDKNLEDAENAKEQFQLVQQAYEILSDRQERAWYDNHREQILRKADSEFIDKTVDVFQYFTTSCFKGYNDAENGFYAVYRSIFSKVAEEDIEFMDDREEFYDIPSFGWSTSDYDEVVGPFYAYWTSYSTKKSFVWLDPYSVQEMRNRRVFKMMEKENKKIRQKAKQDRNEEVRALVAFVRKRDKRVQERSKILEARILENRQKQEELSRAKRLARRKELEESKSEAEWSKFDNVKVQLQEIEKQLAKDFGEEISNEEDDSDSNSKVDCLYCPACNKVFKTAKAFQNHETSKKHKENVEKLKESMMEEAETTSSFNDDESDLVVTDQDDDELHNSNDNESHKSEENDSPVEELICEEFTPEEIDDDLKIKKKQKKSKKVIQCVSDHESTSLNDSKINNLSDSENEFKFSSSSKKQKRKNRKSKGADKNVTESKQEDANCETIVEECSGVEVEVANEKKFEKLPTSKKGKEKRHKKNQLENEQADIDLNHCCVTCKTNFKSKNKLFDHLKKTGHGVYIPQNVKVAKSSKNSVK